MWSGLLFASGLHSVLFHKWLLPLASDLLREWLSWSTYVCKEERWGAFPFVARSSPSDLGTIGLFHWCLTSPLWWSSLGLQIRADLFHLWMVPPVASLMAPESFWHLVPVFLLEATENMLPLSLPVSEPQIWFLNPVYETTHRKKYHYFLYLQEKSASN